MYRIPVSTLLIAAAALAACSPSDAAEQAVPVPPASYRMATPHGTQTAVLAGGCFWGMEAVFERLNGVRSVTAGYAGGKASTATYPQVSSEDTHHAESVRITYDPRQISYATLLRVYFSVAHDPTQRNRQYPDSGPSYRSAIFPQNGAQKLVAERYIAQIGAAHSFAKPIVTRIESGKFYPAEAYHQHYYDRHPDSGYIVRYDKPKVAALRRAFPKLVR